MKKTLKFLLILLGLGLTVQASGLRKLGQRVSRSITASALTALILPKSKTNQSAVALPVACMTEHGFQEYLKYFEEYQECQQQIIADQKITNFVSIKDKYPELYAWFKQRQKELGLEDLDLEFCVKKSETDKFSRMLTLFYFKYFRHKNHMGVPMWTTLDGYPRKIKNGDPLIDIIFRIELDEQFLNYYLTIKSDFETLKIALNHEFAHVLQYLTQSVNGIGPKLHHGETILCNGPMCTEKTIERRLMEQNADAAAYGDCQCCICLYYAAQKLSFSMIKSDSAQMTSEGYCVSSKGYFSTEEILEYAKAAYQDNLPLCSVHASDKETIELLKKHLACDK